MISIKHVFDPVEKVDGRRIWVESVGLCKDLTEWCGVTDKLCKVAPPAPLREWFEEHPDGYDYFRGRYHEWLAASPFKQALQQLACAARNHNITLLHQGDDPEHNSARALQEFLVELEAYCPRDSE